MAQSGGLNPVQQDQYNQYLAQQRAQQEAANRENQIRGDISSGWDAYTNQLNDILNNGLPAQRTAQEGIANDQYTQGLNSLDLQKTQGLQDLGTQRTKVEQNQTKTLRDLSANLRNSFQAGNVFLGAKGAGDSSAANQYAYALTQQGNKQRSDVMQNSANNLSEIDNRETNLKNIYNTEVNNLQAAKDQQINQVASWFAEQQNAIRQAIAQGGLGKSQDLANLSKDILNQGLQAIAQINQNSQARYNALTQWAANNATTIQGLRDNLNQIAQFAPQMQGFSPIAGTPQVQSDGSFYVPAGYGSSTDKKRYIWKSNLVCMALNLLDLEQKLKDLFSQGINTVGQAAGNVAHNFTNGPFVGGLAGQAIQNTQNYFNPEKSTPSFAPSAAPCFKACLTPCFPISPNSFVPCPIGK